MTDRRLDIGAPVGRHTWAAHPTSGMVVCMKARGCDHERARCSRCRADECVHALDNGVCAPCQVRSRTADIVEGIGPGDVAWSFGGGVVEFVETIGDGPPGKRSSRGSGWRR